MAVGGVGVTGIFFDNHSSLFAIRQVFLVPAKKGPEISKL
jgi:hypothetical protein